MNIPPKLLSYRQPLHAFLRSYLEKNDFSQVGSWGPDATKLLADFVTAGKGIRGSLAMFSYEAFSDQKIAEPALPLAAALELFHASFLIHDDIMDEDAVRRGKPSIHAQVGRNVAICMGDLAIFCGYDILTHLPLGSYVSQELAHVAVAQMHDVAPKGKLTLENVLQTYIYKTARYTFSLPLSSGARLANASVATIANLERLGESIGILFQIRDDELDNNVPSILNEKLAEIKSKHQKNAKQILDTMNRLIDTEVLRQLLDYVQARTL